MNILVLQHARYVTLGIFQQFLTEDGHRCTPIYLDEGDALPDLNDYDALWVMGGVMDVWEEEKYPWLVAEKAYIKEAVLERGMPYLGICLGHQLLAEALGGRCGQSEHPEVGVAEVQLTEVGAAGIFMDGLPEKFSSLQWHGAEVKQMPAGAQCLATSGACAVQAMHWGNRAYSVQFHAEVETGMVDAWLAGLTAEELAVWEKVMDSSGVEGLQANSAKHMKAFNDQAERLYINWLQTAAMAQG